MNADQKQRETELRNKCDAIRKVIASLSKKRKTLEDELLGVLRKNILELYEKARICETCKDPTAEGQRLCDECFEDSLLLL